MHYGLFSGARYHHTRGDRDHHIKIHPKNVKTEHGVKFEIFDPLPETPYSVNYATDSITHYEKDAYCRNCDNDTITEIKASIGYECEEGFELTPGNVPGRGFYNKNQVNSKMWEQEHQNVFITSVINDSSSTTWKYNHMVSL